MLAPADLPAKIELHRRSILAAVLLFAFSLRIYSILSLHVLPTADALTFHRIAVSLVSGNGFSLDGIPTAFRPPGFPLLLAGVYAVTHNNLVVAQIVQAFLETVQCGLLYLIARAVFSVPAGLVAAIFWAAYPTSVLQSSLLMGEPLFNCLLLSMLLVTITRNPSDVKTSIFVGLLLGLASLIKPFMAVFGLVIGTWAAWNLASARQGLRVALIISFVTACVLAPWIIRNYVIFHEPLLATHGGVNLWIGNNAHATGGYSVDQRRNPVAGVKNEIERDSVAGAAAWGYIRSHPGRFLLLVPRKIAFLFSSESQLFIHLFEQPRAPATRYARLFVETPWFVHAAVNLHYVFFVSVGLLGIVFFPAERKKELRLFLLLAGFWLLIHIVFFGTQRFRYPLMPLFVLSSAYVAVHAQNVRLKGGGWKTFAYCVLLAGFFSILAAEVITAVLASNS